MPLYMDHHNLPGVKAEAVAEAHEADLRVQGQYGVDYKQYWVDEAGGQVWCLVEAPDPRPPSACIARRTAWLPKR